MKPMICAVDIDGGCAQDQFACDVFSCICQTAAYPDPSVLHRSRIRIRRAQVPRYPRSHCKYPNTLSRGMSILLVKDHKPKTMI